MLFRSADSTTLIRGDTDLDGQVTVLDATRVQRYLADLTTLSDDAKLTADADCDGSVTIMDATAIQRWLADLDDGYPIGEPISAAYEESCFVLGAQDGLLYYDGFTVETILYPDGVEKVFDVF